jgi:hypothetical protein
MYICQKLFRIGDVASPQQEMSVQGSQDSGHGPMVQDRAMPPHADSSQVRECVFWHHTTTPEACTHLILNYPLFLVTL